VAWAEPEALDELPLDGLVEPVLVEPLLVEPLLVEPLLVEPLLVEPLLVEPLLVEPVLVEVLVVESWVEPGSVAATAPVAITLATPTPAVTAASRLIPRRRASAGATARPSVSLGIGIPSPLVLLPTTMRQPPEHYLFPASALALKAGGVAL
jgi:hypothetical protein